MGKKRSILAALLCVMLLAASCGGPASESSSPAASDGASVSQAGSTQQDGASSEGAPANFNPTGYPVVNEPVTISIVAKHDIGEGQYHYGEMQLFQEVSEKTGVQVEWQEIPSSSFSEKKSLIFASGDLPDAFWGENVTDSDVLLNKQYFRPLGDLLQYAPNINAVFEKRPEAKRTITAADGNIYSLFRIRELYFPAGRTTMGINKKWLDKLGLEVPTTTDELYTVLKAFKEQDPNGNGKADEIPFIYQHAMGSGSVRSAADLYPAFGVYENTSNSDLTYHLMMRDGKVLFTPMEEGYKKCLEFQNRLYSEGLLDKEIFTTDSSTFYAKVRSEEDLVGVFIDWTIDDAVGVERAESDFVQLGALVGPDGDQGWGIVSGSQLARNMFEITINNPYPEATMRWVDEFYSPENSIQAFYGPIGEMIQRDGDKLVALEPPEGGLPYGSWKWGRTCADSGAFAALSDYEEMFVPPMQQVARANAEAYVADYLQKEPFPDIFFSDEDTAALKKILVDINSYVESARAQFVTEGIDDNSWNEYVAQLEKMKIQDALDILQRAYDNHMSNG